MTTDIQSAREDLAFLRGLVEGSGRPDSTPGKFFVATGLIWAFDAFVHWAHYVWLEPMTVGQRLVFDGVVTAIWLALAFRLRWGAPESREGAQAGAAARAYGAAFAGVGMSILAMLAVFVTAALRIHPVVLILYPAMVFVFFGAIWLVGFLIWRRSWRLGVALGWFAAAVGMVATTSIPTFIAIAGLAMLLLMALPGAILWRAAQESNP